MRKILLEYKNDLSLFVRNHYILLTIFLTVALGYGFALTNPSISTDDTAASLYFEGGELIAQGRFFPIIINKILGGMNFTPFWLELIAIILMISAGLLYLCLIKRITKDKLSKVCHVLFIPIFISYPLINEIFIYNTAVVSIGIGYLLTAVSTIMVYEFINNKKRILSLLIIPIFLMAAVVSTYESFAGVFIFGLATILFLQYLYNYSDKGFNKKQWIKYVCIFIGVLAVAVLLEYATTTIYMEIHNVVKSKNAATGIVWLGSNGIIGNIKPFIKSIYYNFMNPNVGYLPITILQITAFTLLIFATIKSIIQKKYWVLFFAGLLILSLISLSFVQGIASPYRVCQSFALFVALVSIIIYDQIPKKIRPLIFIGILYLITMQTYDLTKWFYNDNLRYQEDKSVMTNVAQTIRNNFDDTKPIVFIGEYTQKSNIMHNQTNGWSFINWGKANFGGPCVQLLKFLELNGEYFIRPTPDQYKMAWENLDNMTRWPKDGSIVEYKGVIVVRF